MRLHPVQRKIYFTLLSVYDPRMTNAEEAKEESCSDLSESIVRVATDDKLILVGHFNAKFGLDFQK